MPYIKNGVITADPWVYEEDGDPLDAATPIIVSAGRLLAEGPQIAALQGDIGVKWPNDKPVLELAPHLPRLKLVALAFPAFKDGRAYTQARQLREQHGFAGELRATGNVLRDQFLFMVRAGFDAFEVQKASDAEAFAKAIREFSVVYQSAADARTPAFKRRLASVSPFQENANARD